LVRILTQSLKIITILMVAVIAVAGAAWFFDYWQDRDPSDTGRPVVLEVTPDDDSGTVAEKLKDDDMIRFPAYFETRMRFEDVDLRPGVYTLRKGMSTMEIIDAITVDAIATGQGTPEDGGGDAQVIEVTLIEGQRAEQFGEEIEKAGYPNGKQVFMDALKDPAVRQGWDFLKGVPADASLEGFLFPDTYRFSTDYTGADLVSMMLANFDAKVSEKTRESFADQGLSIYQAITIASIVEREAAVAEERPEIAAVYLNRLNQDPPMLLNADPTIQYAVGTPNEWWPELTSANLEIDSPYNTYLYEGLPPTPISNPGIASIQAVGQPADVDYLYFVAKHDGSGEHVFATTYEEHQANVCQYDPEGCEGASMPAPTGMQVAYIDDRWRAA
jgi:UPF0755 protein